MGSRNAVRLDHLALFPDLSLLPNCIYNAARCLMLNFFLSLTWLTLWVFPLFISSNASGHISRIAGANWALGDWPTRKQSIVRLWLQNVFCYCCAFTYLLLLFFSGVCRVGNGCQVIPTALNVVWLSHGNILFYSVFLPIDYYKYDFLLSCTV